MKEPIMERPTRGIEQGYLLVTRNKAKDAFRRVE